jgi:hypothetical protein
MNRRLAMPVVLAVVLVKSGCRQVQAVTHRNG